MMYYDFFLQQHNSEVYFVRPQRVHVFNNQYRRKLQMM